MFLSVGTFNFVNLCSNIAEIVLLLLMSLVSSSIQGNYMMPNQAANYNPKTDGVVELTQKNFKTLVLNSDAHWLVIFEFPGPQFVFISPL